MKVMEHVVQNKRYIGLGTVDGILATIGTCLAAYAMNLDPLTVGIAAAGGAVALSMTNFFGSYIGETSQNGEFNHEVAADMIAHGGFTLLGAGVPLAPFFFITDPLLAVIGSLISSVIGLIVLGSVIGKGTKKGIGMTIVELVLIGILIAFITFKLGG